MSFIEGSYRQISWNLVDFLFIIIFLYWKGLFILFCLPILPFFHSLINRISTDSAHWLENLSHPSLLELLNIHICRNFALVDCHSAYVLLTKHNYWTNHKLLNPIHTSRSMKVTATFDSLFQSSIFQLIAKLFFTASFLRKYYCVKTIKRRRRKVIELTNSVNCPWIRPSRMLYLPSTLGST